MSIPPVLFRRWLFQRNLFYLDKFWIQIISLQPFWTLNCPWWYEFLPNRPTYKSNAEIFIWSAIHKHNQVNFQGSTWNFYVSTTCKNTCCYWFTSVRHITHFLVTVTETLASVSICRIRTNSSTIYPNVSRHTCWNMICYVEIRLFL